MITPDRHPTTPTPATPSHPSPTCVHQWEPGAALLPGSEVRVCLGA